MIMTGKRHDFVIDYDVGFDDSGQILGIDFIFNGWSLIMLALTVHSADS